jgi:hypothetical protein
MSLSLLQDLQLSDENFLDNFKYFWENKDYTRAIDILKNNQQLATKYASAEWFNHLTDYIYQLETVSSDWDKKQIVVSYLPPDSKPGDIWFQIQLGSILINVYISILSIGSTTTSISYEDTLINAVAFSGGEEIITNQVINESGHTVTFSIGEVYDKLITCIVYSTDNANVVVDTDSIITGTTTFQMSYSGALLSAIYLDNSNNKQIVNMNIQSSYITYTLNTASTVATVGRIVYIPTNKLGEILHASSQTFSSIMTTLLCEGYMVNCFITDYLNDIVLGNVEFYLNNAVIRLPQNTNNSFNCILYYT